MRPSALVLLPRRGTRCISSARCVRCCGGAPPALPRPCTAPAALTGAAAHAARKDLARIETRMARIEALRGALHAQMADAHTDHERLLALAAEDAALAAEHADLEDRWLELAEALEA